MVHQELNQALKRNVMDNMWLGRYPENSDRNTSYQREKDVRRDEKAL